MKKVVEIPETISKRLARKSFPKRVIFHLPE